MNRDSVLQTSCLSYRHAAANRSVVGHARRHLPLTTYHLLLSRPRILPTPLDQRRHAGFDRGAWRVAEGCLRGADIGKSLQHVAALHLLVLAQRRAQCRLAIATARKRRTARPLEGQVPTLSCRVDEFPEQQGAAIPQVWRELAELVSRVGLRQRLGDRAEVEFVMVASPAEAQAQWRQWQQRSEVMAVLAPPWRGWRPPAPAEGTVALAALFPLVADPETGRVQSVQWLFGGVEARAVALVQAWLQQPQAQSATLPVWVGEGALAPAAPEMLERMAQGVRRDTGRTLAWQVLDSPRLRTGEVGLWLDAQRPPGDGWWLLPHGATASPGPAARWWVAAPFAGHPPRSLAQRWADATCRTAQAAIADQPVLSRERWLPAVANTARLRDGAGWEWHVPAHDEYGYGASTAWTIVEIAGGTEPTPVAPQVNIGRPIEAAR